MAIRMTEATILWLVRQAGSQVSCRSFHPCKGPLGFRQHQASFYRQYS